MKWADGKIRCCWANPRNERYIRYHDEEWGVPVHDDRKLFEMLILECFQAGLSWECVLNKRQHTLQGLYHGSGSCLGCQCVVVSMAWRQAVDSVRGWSDAV